jgi:hypothetical protein
MRIRGQIAARRWDRGRPLPGDLVCSFFIFAANKYQTMVDKCPKCGKSGARIFLFRNRVSFILGSEVGSPDAMSECLAIYAKNVCSFTVLVRSGIYFGFDSCLRSYMTYECCFRDSPDFLLLRVRCFLSAQLFENWTDSLRSVPTSSVSWVQYTLPSRLLLLARSGTRRALSARNAIRY